ncbi:MAG TPA: RHS repeat-associated core domain-containing protein, partial [Thermoanaerobaculia bacterium]|nr:RHS repeat-associated core domain-containing protein [Thermoanaerobaculia bacterium]
MTYEGARKSTRTLKVATTTSGETNAVTTEIYDRYGRLYEVTEPNNVRTRHDYDVGGRLTKVCQVATGVGTATCGQARLFNYDLRGFLLSEQNPEKGASGNGTVSYYNYDARGHALRMVDGTSDLTFTYDKAERLTQIRETGGAQRVLKSFTWATANLSDASGTDYRKGKVISASRFNYVGTPFNATAEVRDTYAYRGTEGRASEHTRQLFVNAGAEESFTTGYAYDGLGLVSSIGYPDCVFGDCTASDTARNVSFGYSYGRLTSVPGYTGTAGGVSEITYHPNGMVHQVPHSNGVLFTQQNDPNGMPRPSGMTATNPTTTLWTAGTHTWDGSGNLKAIGAQTFAYDNLSRITQANITGSSQGFAYDNYGNIQSITTDGVALNTPTSSSTNRLTGGIYDASGNLTSWNGNSYQYDAFNQMSRFTSGTEDWIYVYGADDERLWSYKADGTGSLWALRDLGGTVLRQYNAHLGWTNYEDYIYRDDKLLANYLSGGQRRHFDVDHLGTVRLVTNLAGNQVGFHRYYPFGKEQTALQEGDRMKFTGHERDLANTGGDGDDLDYMHARHYNPHTARFTSVDTLPAYLRAPQSWNRYAYVEGGPMTYVDPDGLGKVGFIAKIVRLTFGGGRKTVTRVYSREAAMAAQKKGHDVLMQSRKAAEDLASELSDGKPPIHEVGKGKGQYPHYHPADRSGGHIFYNIAAGLTLSHYAEGQGSFLEGLAELGDLVNPLALPQDLIDLFEMFVPREDTSGEIAGDLTEIIQVTAPKPTISWYTYDFLGGIGYLPDARRMTATPPTTQVIVYWNYNPPAK